MAAGKPASGSVLTLRRNENGKLVAALPALPARYRFAAGFRPAAAAAGGEDRFLPVEKNLFSICLLLGAISYLYRSCQKATALAAATFSESTPWYMGMRTV